MLRFTLLALTIAALPLPATAMLAEAPKSAPARKADLADSVAGVYKGNVTSDARGSSKRDVTITVTRVGANMVEITSDYARIPTITITLQKAMNAILAARGPAVFLLDTVRSPDRLDLTIDDAAWVGYRASPNP